MGRDHRRSKRAYFMGYFNPLSPHGERPDELGISPRTVQFQSDSPRMGRDHARLGAGGGKHPISIHSPRMGRDISTYAQYLKEPFQSTLPAWGETGRGSMGLGHRIYFNPLSPHGERRYYASRGPRRLPISIHSPRMGRDAKGDVLKVFQLWRFQSTLPAWGETNFGHI